MKKNLFLLLCALPAILLIFGLPGCTKDDGDDVIVPTVKAFAGTESCKSCHSGIHSSYMESGHPYKLQKVSGAQPTIPFAPTILTPTGYTWNDLSYIIGGYGWKARFIDKNGYVITQVAGSQFNPGNLTQTIYNSAIPNGTEKYTCGRCHTTGWKSIADGGTPQDGLPGMDGNFFAGGVQCEQCHGMGNIHAVTKKKSDITLDKTTEACSQCHQRRKLNGDVKQQVSNGWEMHRSQVEQLLTNKHNLTLTCNSCHEVHSSTVKDDLAKGNGISKTCVSCHNTINANVHNGATCIDCHMSKTVKNAISFNKYKGDAPNHNFKINTSATATYLTTDGSGTWANLDGKGTTLDFACYSCHQDTAGVGGIYSKKTMQELATKAITFHK
ncbi:MAG: cytochrome c3 family protein [Bacteroidales bacterium]|nr:cytochrome c3 family protein [Bacteroidales bacterium]